MIDAPKIGSSTHMIPPANNNDGGHRMITFGGTPTLRLGRLIHQESTPVTLSQTNDIANAVLSHRLAGPKSPS
jgi:hypothetical protein